MKDWKAAVRMWASRDKENLAVNGKMGGVIISV